MYLSYLNVTESKKVVYYFKSAERFPGCLRVLIHGSMSMFREHCSSLHQGEK